MKPHFLPALRGLMGTWEYYVCLMPLADLAKRVSFAKELHDDDKLSEWIQRVLDTGKRTQDIARYLGREPERFFNSLVVAVYGGDPNWYSIGDYRAAKGTRVSDADLPEFAKGSVGFLGFDGSELFFALDGQHRLAGIRAALKKNKHLADEVVSVIFVGHSKTAKGKQRTRRLFTVLNKTAVKVKKKDIIALDEDDVMAICCRRLVEQAPRFGAGKIHIVANNNLPPTGSLAFTTIGNLYDVLKRLFLWESQVKEEELRFHRPAEEELVDYYNLALRYFDLLGEAFAPVARFFNAKTERARSKIVGRYRSTTGGHLLFRPVGLRVLTEVVTSKHGSGTLEERVALASLLPVDLAKSPLSGVLWQGKMQTSGAALARDLYLHMLHEFPKSKAAQLKVRYRKRVEDEQATLPKRISQSKLTAALTSA